MRNTLFCMGKRRGRLSTFLSQNKDEVYSMDFASSKTKKKSFLDHVFLERFLLFLAPKYIIFQLINIFCLFFEFLGASVLGL